MLTPGRLGKVLPPGAVAVGSGLLVQGITAYGFLVVSARALGPERYVGISVLWALTFLVAFGVFFPLEQELARALASRKASGAGGGLIVRQVLLVGALLLAVVLLATLLGAPLLLDTLFDHQVLLVVGLALSLAAYLATHLARGLLSGIGALVSYGKLLAAEGFIRLAACLALAAAGSTNVGMYGLVFALSPLVAVVLTVRPKQVPPGVGPDVSFGELSTAVGHLVAGSVLSQALLNGPVLASKILASDQEQAAAGRLLAGLAAARVQLFVFSAVYIAVLPKLASFASLGQATHFRAEFRRLVLLVAAIGVLSTIAAFLVGEPGIRLVFGSEFSLSRRDLTLLTGATAMLLLALTSGQGLVAVAAHRRVAAGWLCGVGAFLAATGAPGGVILRVEIAFLVGCTAAAGALAALLHQRLRHPIGLGGGLDEAVHPALEVPPS
ncbi:MAG: hypothetical protein M3450_00155 [Actinomycetota bacterium]|nr:hypothetical protein [Actinomycetota bacterium]